MDEKDRERIRTRLKIIEAGDTIRRYTWDNDYFQDRFAAAGLAVGTTPFFLDTYRLRDNLVVFQFNLDDALDWENPPPIARELAQECIEFAKTSCPDFQSYLQNHPNTTVGADFYFGATAMSAEELEEMEQE